MKTGLGIYQLLQASSAVTDLVGTRVFPSLAAQGATMPFVTYEILQITPSDEKDGPSALDEVRVEVACFAATYSAAADLGAKVRLALDRMALQGDGVAFQSVRFHDVQDEVLDAPRRFVQVQDYTIRQLADFTGSLYLGQPVVVTDGDGTEVQVQPGSSYECLSTAPVRVVDGDGTEVQVQPGGSYECLSTAPPAGISYSRPNTIRVGQAYEGDHGYQFANGLLPYPAPPAYPATFQEVAKTNVYDSRYQSFALLKYDNIFGNQYRWTNTAGNRGTRMDMGYAEPMFHYMNDWNGAVKGYVIDHLTGLAWTAYSVNPPNGTRTTNGYVHGGLTYIRPYYTFPSFANYAHGLNGETQFDLGGFTDWRIPTLEEIISISIWPHQIQGTFAWSIPSSSWDFEALEKWYVELGQTGNPPRGGGPIWGSSRWGTGMVVQHSYYYQTLGINNTYGGCLVRNHY